MQSNIIRTTVVLLVFLLLPVANLFAQDSLSIRKLGEGFYKTSGFKSPLVVNDGIGYITGELFYTVDVSDPSDFKIIGYCKLPPDYRLSTRIAISPGIAVVHYPQGLRLIDISDPFTPRVVNPGFQIPSNGDFPSLSPVTIRDGYLYVAEESRGLYIYDISDPAKPEIISLFDGGTYLYGVYDRYAYLQTDKYPIVVDISNLAQPHAVDTLDFYISSLQFRDKIAFSLREREHDLFTLNAIDFALPRTPRLISSMDLPKITVGYAGTIQADGDRGLVNLFENLYIIDLANPEEMVISHTILREDLQQAWLKEKVLLSAVKWEEGSSITAIRAIDLADPENPQIVKETNYDGWIADAEIIDDRLYLIDRFSSIAISDVDDQHQFHTVGSLIENRANALNVHVIDTTLWVLRDIGLRWYNISDPANPVFGDFIPDGIGTVNGQFVDKLVYLVQDRAENIRTLQIFDIANPLQFRQLSSTPLVKSPRTVAVGKGRAYVGTADTGVYVFNIADSTAPVELGYAPLPDTAVSITLEGQFAFVGFKTTGLGIYDITNPLPIAVSTYRGVKTITDIAIDDHYAYLTADSQGIVVLDIEDIANPVEVAHYQTGGLAKQIKVTPDGLVYLNDHYAFGIYQLIKPAGVESGAVLIPSAHMLNTYPNPFNRNLTLHYAVPNGTFRMDIYSLEGRLVKNLFHNGLASGVYRSVWTPDPGIGAGIYFVALTNLETNGRSITKVVYLP